MCWMLVSFPARVSPADEDFAVDGLPESESVVADGSTLVSGQCTVAVVECFGVCITSTYLRTVVTMPLCL